MAGTARRTDISAAEAVFVSALCFGWAILGSTGSLFAHFPAQRFSNDHFVTVIAMELAFGALALWFLTWRRYAVGTLYPSPTFLGTLLGMALYFATTLAAGVASTMASAFVTRNPVSEMLQGAQTSLALTVAVSMINGAYEEIFLLGVLQRGLLRYGSSIALGAPLLVRILYHTYQGPAGIVGVLGFGAVIGYFYLRRPDLYPAVFCHILCDIIAFVASGVAR